MALDVVEQIGGGEGCRTPFSLSLVHCLEELLGAARAGYFEYRLGGSPAIAVEEPGVDFRGALEATDVSLSDWPLRDPFGMRSTAVLALSDRLSRRARRRNPFHRLVSRPLGVEDEMKLWLPSPPDTARGFFFVRDTAQPDFGEREHVLVELLALHLARGRRRWEDARLPTPLTPREVEVLQLVASGHTNKEIAALLVVATGTVRAHLDHIYEKLDVHTRTAAAATLRLTQPAG